METVPDLIGFIAQNVIYRNSVNNALSVDNFVNSCVSYISVVIYRTTASLAGPPKILYLGMMNLLKAYHFSTYLNVILDKQSQHR